MASLRALLLRVPSALRYVAAGAVNALFYIALTLLLSGPLGLPIQIAIPISYVTAMCTHFMLQRVVVFAHVDDFALRGHEQAGRYVVIGVIQYALTATTTAVVPAVTGWPEQAVYVATALVIAGLTFLFLRYRVFHAATAK